MRLLRTLYAQLALGLLLLLLAIGALYSLISLTITDSYLRQLNQQINRDLARNLVADRNLVEEGRLNQQALQETFSLYMSINPSIEIYLLDSGGRILSYSADPGKIKRNTVSLAPIKAFLQMEDPQPLLGDDPRSHERQKAFSVTAIPGPEGLEGYLYVVLRGEQYDAAEALARSSYLLRMNGWAMAASLGLGLLGGLIVFHLLTRRLRRLAQRMEQFAAESGKPDLASIEAPRNSDEVEALAFTFERMAQRIGQQIEQLQQQDGLRRRLVAQVSHDLRTPLASMLGYLESLQLKRGTLSEAQREQFLQIALRQGQRLGQMLAELFELASLEARESPPQLEPFALAELIQDTLEKHRVTAQSKGISLTLAPLSHTPLAYGDIGMTERVLDNLLDNAIRHTPARGVIAVSLSLQPQRIRVSIRDPGPGIPADQLALLFDPFYRGDSGEHPREHAGLGLAIAKRIMALQNGSISAENVSSGSGSSFSFELPLYPVEPAVVIDL